VYFLHGLVTCRLCDPYHPIASPGPWSDSPHAVKSAFAIVCADVSDIMLADVSLHNGDLSMDSCSPQRKPTNNVNTRANNFVAIKS
jgi:hypothetical protein